LRSSPSLILAIALFARVRAPRCQEQQHRSRVEDQRHRQDPGTTTPFWWGSSISPQQANYDGNSIYGNGPKGEYRQRTLPVDSFGQNPWGLYQVHGNVFEWTEDCYHNSYNGAPADGSAWLSEDWNSRVLRGGSWRNDQTNLRAANRFWNGPNVRSLSFGFRVGRTLITP
jgi:formylglycine-generating enzyme required for sulfatase activity